MIQRRPTKDELLRSFAIPFMETKLHEMHGHRVIKDNSDLLFTSLRSAPARSIVTRKCVFDREARVLRRYLHRRDLFEIKPALVRFASLAGIMRSHYPLTHYSIIVSERRMARGGVPEMWSACIVLRESRPIRKLRLPEVPWQFCAVGPSPIHEPAVKHFARSTAGFVYLIRFSSLSSRSAKLSLIVLQRSFFVYAPFTCR